MTDLLIPFVFILIVMLLFWCLNDVLLYAVLAIVSTDITIDVLNSGDNFFTIPPSLHAEFSIVWIFLTLVGWSHTFRLARKANERYNKKLTEE